MYKLDKPQKRGRPLGSPNKNTEALKTTINLFLKRNLADLQQNYDLLEAKEKLSFIKDLLPFVAPKMASVQADLTSDGKGIESIAPVINILYWGDKNVNKIIKHQSKYLNHGDTETK